MSYLLEGSVRKAGNGIRITAHMVRGNDEIRRQMKSPEEARGH